LRSHCLLASIRLAAIVFAVLASLAACDAKGTAGPGATASTGGVRAVDSSPTEAERAATAAADKAADEIYPRVEELGALVARSKAGGDGKTDCKKLGEELGKFVRDDLDAMVKSRESGGGKNAVERALKRQHGDTYGPLFDRILEATEVDCSGESAVAEAARKIDL
jgi:hypothetical protein